MAARLSINSIFEKRLAYYFPKICAWGDRRDALNQTGRKAAARAAQKKVDYYYAKAYERGYFGDNYQANLLARFGLCWTRDIYVALLGKRDEITPADARRLLRILKDKEQILEANLRTVRRVAGMTRTETVRYYRDKYTRLQSLLREAIARNEAIDFSR
jgi:hypothetical protein